MKSIQLKYSKGKDSSGLLGAIIIPTVLVVCCVSHIALLVLVAVGLIAFTPYLDYYVLLLAIVVIILLAITSYGKWKKSCNTC